MLGGDLMAEFSLTTPTVVTVGSAIPYNNTIIKGCCCIKHRNGSGTIKVKGGTCCNPNRYRVDFHANVTGEVGDIQLGIFLDGELLPETVMSLVSGSVDYVQSVNASTEFYTDGCFNTISARVIEGDLIINTANIIVHKGVA